MSTIDSKPKQLQDLTQIFQNCGERAATYDRENRFFTEDFEELKEAGYLLMALPENFGGYGMNMAEVAQKTRELAYHAAPTALALNMHNYWVGLISDLWRQGDTSLEWLLEKLEKERFSLQDMRKWKRPSGFTFYH